MPSYSAPQQTSPRAVALATIGFVVALAGTYWDDAWHTDRGRDEFFIAPHICLYAGITIAGAALGLQCLLVIRARGLHAALRDVKVLFSVGGLLVTLGAAPIDNAWHIAFGRDAVLWSPPHMLGVAGSLAIAISLLLFARDLEPPRPLLRWTIAASVLSVCLIPVMEYETDVPQFDLVWYLPLLTFGSAIALSVIRSIVPGRWSATKAALAYTALRVAITLTLLAGSFSAPLVPLIAIPALVLDYAAGRGARRLTLAAALAISVFVLYVPYLDWVRSDVFLDRADVAIGLPLAVLLAYVGLWIGAQPSVERPPRLRLSLAASLIASLLLLAPNAFGHDPGQGEEVGTAELTARVDGQDASLAIDLTAVDGCESIEPTSLVARRSGMEISADLSESDPCIFAGAVELPARGRWFLYGSFAGEGGPLETWLPVESGKAQKLEDGRPLYVPPEVSGGPIKVALGVVAYAALVIVLALSGMAIRRLPAPGPQGGSVGDAKL